MDKQKELLIELAKSHINNKEMALKRLINAKILDKHGNFTDNYPNLNNNYERKNKYRNID